MWCDVVLQSIEWAEAGRDLVVEVLVPAGRVTNRRVLVCRWAEAVLVQLAFRPGHLGPALSWDATFERLPDGKCSILFDFASDGEIRLVCASLEVRETPLGGPEIEP